MRKIFIEAANLSIGDTVASMPYISKFQELNKNDKVILMIRGYLIPFFETIYDNLEYVSVEPKEFDIIIPLKYNYNKSIQKGYAEQLGFHDAPYIRPKILIPELTRPIKNKYVAMGIHSTAQLKYWNHPNGKRVQMESPYWNELCGMIRKANHTPVVVEQHELFGDPKFFNGLPTKANKKFGQSFLESMNLIYHSEFFIGLSSGMAWVAHAMGKPVVMIANFTEDWNEFDLSCSDYIRITNKDVCHGCWNMVGVEFEYDPFADWYWCPRHQNTERQFECHKSITPEHVYKQIEKWIN